MFNLFPNRSLFKSSVWIKLIGLSHKYYLLLWYDNYYWDKEKSSQEKYSVHIFSWCKILVELLVQWNDALIFSHYTSPYTQNGYRQY